MESFLTSVQLVISSPIWAIGTIILTLGWMLYESHFAAHPIEGGFNNWADTVLIYTLITVWMENFIKVQQAHSTKLQQQQADRMEFILRFLVDENKSLQTVLARMQKNDEILHHLIKVTNQLAEGLYAAIEKEHTPVDPL